MGCGCGKNKGTDLEKYAFLTPKQLKLREQQRKLKQQKQQEEEE